MYSGARLLTCQPASLTTKHSRRKYLDLVHGNEQLLHNIMAKKEKKKGGICCTDIVCMYVCMLVWR